MQRNRNHKGNSMRQKVIGRMYGLLGQTDKQRAVEQALQVLVREAVVSGQHIKKAEDMKALMKEADKAWRAFSARSHGIAKPGGFKDFMKYHYPALAGTDAGGRM